MSKQIIEQLGWRLPRYIIPKHYNLYLYPDLKTKTFSGNVTINLQITKPTDFIAIHSKSLTITNTSVTQPANNNNKINIAQTYECRNYEYWITELSDPLPVGEYNLALTFNGSLINRIVGFYQSSYNDSNTNTKRYIATSKFEPTYARQAFPCFDEPAMKAKFKISLVIPRGDGYMALSNMDVLVQKPIPDAELDVVCFNESVPMSTYLACFIVSDFVYESKSINSRINGEKFDMRIFATSAQLSKVNFALNTGAAITEFYIDYFKIPYPLPKLDMVAIPDFVSGAMEHWGLVTFRETALLYDEKISATSNKQRVAIVVAHEFAHMWFGNLVTMAWWNDLWLNEGFASYIEYKGVNEVYPQWGMMDQFLIEDLHSVLALDATLSSHPIVQVAENPDQITELFDTITYSKGASIIRMLENFIGPINFQNAVTAYLNRHKYGNAVTDDLLTEIDNLNLGYNVKEIMATWTEQMGYPIVNVEQISDTQYRLTQKRFLSNPASYDAEQAPSKFNYKWTIPITYLTDIDDKKFQWFDKDDDNILINVTKNHSWIKLNNEQIDYYRINYPLTMWKKFTDCLIADVTTLNISNRAHLLNDAFSLAEATLLDYSIALNLTSYLKNETDYVPWSVASSKIINLKNFLYNSDAYPKFITYSHSLLKTAYDTVNWDDSQQTNEYHLKNLLRTTILSLACSVGMKSCLDEAVKRFNKWLDDGHDERPLPELRTVIYYYGIQSIGDNQKKWNHVWELYKSELDASEKIKLINALSAAQSTSILKRFIELAWDENNVRGQDYFSCLQYIAANRIGEPLVWDYVRENWLKLVERFGLNERYLGQLIPGITRRFSTQEQLEQMMEFFAIYPDAGAGAAARKNAIDTVKYNINWLSQNKQKVNDWLDVPCYITWNGYLTNLSGPAMYEKFQNIKMKHHIYLCVNH